MKFLCLLEFLVEKCSWKSTKSIRLSSQCLTLITILIACENIRFSSLFAAGDVSRGGSGLLSVIRKQRLKQCNYSVDQSALLTGFRTGFTSSVWNFCRWVADVPPRETSPAAKSEEKRMFSQTMFSYPQNCSIIPSLVGSVIAPSDLLSDSFCVLNKQRLNNSGLLAISLAMCCSYGNLS